MTFAEASILGGGGGGGYYEPVLHSIGKEQKGLGKKSSEIYV